MSVSDRKREVRYYAIPSRAEALALVGQEDYLVWAQSKSEWVEVTDPVSDMRRADEADELTVVAAAMGPAPLGARLLSTWVTAKDPFPPPPPPPRNAADLDAYARTFEAISPRAYRDPLASGPSKE
jgi:hypothetical protein